MSYRQPFEEAMDDLQQDLMTVREELENILDMSDIQDIKIALSNSIQTINSILGEP